ncbi:hypothetical protein KDH_12100 [Dictyobacter sp. S3.2.2.5]|uniref:Knr4/Smi1-like domain-containing protein n=1 Tax=Dictyobacter halimunensis TaxID=3026934 RepID=A0ABQ6FNG9_9CHLR|nr:hypothetical protein KDH_12100 [Dictyobacter sp. S3.2.2.5]
MDAIQHSWCRIETWMQHHAPYTWPKFVPGISDRDIQLAEEILGMTLPADFTAFYRIHNGQFWLDFVSHMQLLPLQKVVKTWMEMQQLWKKGVFERRKPYYFFDRLCKDWETGPIQPVWWHPQSGTPRIHAGACESKPTPDQSQP